MTKRIIIWFGLLILQIVSLPVPASAGTNAYILWTPTAAQAQAVCQRYGLELVRNLGQPDVFMVVAPDSVTPETLQKWVENDPDVQHLELEKEATVPEAFSTSNPLPTVMPVTTAIIDGRLIWLYGPTAWVGYVNQPAMALIDSTNHEYNGSGIVAIIDTGVDPHHPLLTSVLVPGYDFTRNIEGSASELADLNQSTAAILEQSNSLMLMQSTAAILEGSSFVRLNQSTAAILEQSTAAILEGQRLPAYFGHGTMVAGLVHLVAPRARIMPLKAFRADGSAKMSDIVRAIYYASNHNVKVINMSFSVPQFSHELTRAINYATRKGAICVASVGNQNRKDLVYPAALVNVIGVGSTTLNDQRSAFSNYGSDLVTVAAPGEELYTTYPGAHYAAVWGTSFSSGLVAGAASLLVNTFVVPDPSVSLAQADVRRALSRAISCGTCDLGSGRLDLAAAETYVKQLTLPPPR